MHFSLLDVFGNCISRHEYELKHEQAPASERFANFEINELNKTAIKTDDNTQKMRIDYHLAPIENQPAYKD